MLCWLSLDLGYRQIDMDGYRVIDLLSRKGGGEEEVEENGGYKGGQDEMRWDRGGQDRIGQDQTKWNKTLCVKYVSVVFFFLKICSQQGYTLSKYFMVWVNKILDLSIELIRYYFRSAKVKKEEGVFKKL